MDPIRTVAISHYLGVPSDYLKHRFSKDPLRVIKNFAPQDDLAKYALFGSKKSMYLGARSAYVVAAGNGFSVEPPRSCKGKNIFDAERDAEIVSCLEDAIYQPEWERAYHCEVDEKCFSSFQRFRHNKLVEQLSLDWKISYLPSLVEKSPWIQQTRFSAYFGAVDVIRKIKSEIQQTCYQEWQDVLDTEGITDPAERVFTPIDEAPLSSRLKHVLRLGRVGSIGQASQFTESQFRKIRTAGPKTLEELKKYLATVNLSMKSD